MFKKEDMVRVSADAPLYAGKIGYFQCYGRGQGKDLALLSTHANHDDCKHTLFSVHRDHVMPLEQ